jgi:hypothetical protein
MNRQQRRAAGLRGRSRGWDSADLDVPLHDFMAMFELTEAEMRAEGGSGRIAGAGVRSPDGRGYSKVVFRESSITRWLRSDLPSAIAAKVEKAGGFDRLTAWRKDYFSKIQWLWGEDALILPDGERIEGLRVRREDVERLWGGKDWRH